MRYTKSEVEEARARLLEWIKPGDTVYTILRHVSRSNMSRNISVVVLKDGTPLHPNHAVSRVTGLPLVRAWNDSIKMNGAGEDKGFALIYELGQSLFPGGVPCAGQKDCHSNDHRNSGSKRDDYSLTITHSDGGYAFKQQWL